MKRRLFEIKSVRKIIPNSRFEYYGKADNPFIEIIIKNVSNFDLDLHYYKNSLWAASCIEYVNDPSTAECMFFADTSCLIKKNEEFMIYVPLLMSVSKFSKHEFQGVKFRLLVSSSFDLSFYFENNPTQTLMPKYKIMELYDNRKKYTYPFEFTYWVPYDIFWESYLLE